jgi:tetratricopeptide (TPR) repeat protein
VCLHGLFFGSHLSDQADRILALSEDMINKGEDEADVYYWRAYAMRREGRFEDALATIDKAIGVLPVGRNDAHAAYARERAIITGTQLLGEQLQTYTDQLQGQSRHHQDQLEAQFGQHRDQEHEQFRLHRELQQEQFRQHRDELRTEADQHTSSARRIVSDSLLGIVEVLALFAVLVSYLVALVALAVRAEDVWQSLAMVALMVLGAGGIFTVMRAVARMDRGRSRIRRSPVRRLGEWLGFTETPAERQPNSDRPTVKTG